MKLIHKAGKKLMYNLSKDIRLKHDEASDNYYLFCIKTGKHIRLNIMSYEILRLLEQGKDRDTIIQFISDNYDTDQTTCAEDVDEFFRFLQKNGMLHC